MGIDGFLVVDKPEGIPSLDVVREVKRRFGVRKAGHVGTLDPFATGVLPVALNEGTKLIPFLREEPKGYEGTLKLGEETTTEDLTGDVISTKPWTAVTPDNLRNAFDSFLGRVSQILPMFSAVKFQGKPLYRLAREGLEIERKKREVQIFEIGVEEVDLPRVRFWVSCSKGTYVRTLAKDIGRRIGSGAHLVQLRRVQSGFFSIEQAMPWETLQTLASRDLPSWLVTLEEALSALPEMRGDDRLVRKIRMGQAMRSDDLSPQFLPNVDQETWVKMTAPGGGLVAILKSEGKASGVPRTEIPSVIFRPVRVFHSNTE